MDIKNVKVGTKVKLLGKHRVYDEYDNIEDWFDDFYHEEDVQQIKKQGYGVITDICVDGDIWVSNTINGNKWCFSISDLEPYEEEFFEKSQENKTPKEWLLTPKAIFITRDSDEEYVVLGNNTAIGVNSGCMCDDDLVNNYTDDLKWYDNLPNNDIMSITYGGNVVWERKEYMTLTDAIKTGKNIKHKNWDKYYTISEILRLIRIKCNSDLINDFTVVEWEVEE